MSETARVLQNMIVGLMAVRVDDETSCGREVAIQVVWSVMMGEYVSTEPTPDNTYSIVRLAIETVKQGQKASNDSKMDTSDKEL